MSLEQVVDLLKRIRDQQPDMKDCEIRFSRAYVNSEIEPQPEGVEEILDDVFERLQYFVVDPVARKESSLYLSPDEMTEIIDEAFQKLREYGVDI